MCVCVSVVCRSVDRGVVCKESMGSSVYYAMFWVVHSFCSLHLLTSECLCNSYDKCVLVWFNREQQIWCVLVVCIFCIDVCTHFCSPSILAELGFSL